MCIATGFRHPERYLIYSFSGILVLTALSKLYTVMGNVRMLDLYDPVLLLSNRRLLTGVAVIELFCAMLIVRTRHPWFAGLILLWLGANFLMYRVAVSLGGAITPCPCLGSVGGRLGLSQSATDVLMHSILVYFLAGGLYLLVRHGSRVSPANWRNLQKSPS